MILSILLTGLTAPFPQATSTPSDPISERILARFSELPDSERERIATRAEREALTSRDPFLHGAALLEDDPRLAAMPVLPPDPVRAYPADRYAPRLGLRTRILKKGTRSWKELAAKLLGKASEAPEGTVWAYSAGRKALIRPTREVPPLQRLRAQLAGHWPRPDFLLARIEALLDTATEIEPLADFFTHTYRDRRGSLYSGIQIQDVWDSGSRFGISDVETLAWLDTVHHEKQLRAPIPKRLHDPLYSRMETDFIRWRAWRDLHRALAQRYLALPRPLPGEYAHLAAELDRAWQSQEWSPERMAALLKTCPDRVTFFASLPVPDPQLPRPALPEFAPAAQVLRGTALRVAREEGLLGLGRRR